jgi:DNA-binding CsgD family transcriptional regulator
MYVDYFRPYGEEREMMLCLPSERFRVVRLLFWRGPGPDFSERDRGLLTLLRPHLHAAFQRRRRPSTDAVPLTPRQLELLQLVAVGCTNHQIARRLSITEATVRKHLEHVFERLHVTSRTAAVTRAFGHASSVPTPHPVSASGSMPDLLGGRVTC